MQRITQKDLEAVCNRINITTKSPEAAYTKTGNKYNANIGNYHLDYAYGGVALHRMSNIHGGIHDVFSGHMSKRELYHRMHAYLSGLLDAINA